MASRRDKILIVIPEEDLEREYEEVRRRIVDLTQDDSDDERPRTAQQGQESHGRRRPKTQRNAPLNGYRSVLSYNVGGVTYCVNNFFELAQPVGEYWKTQFIEVKQIWVSISGNEVLLRGFPYARTNSLRGRIEHRINEVCQIIEIDDNDSRPDEQQAMIQVRPDDILTIRDFHKTNTDFGSSRNCRYGNDPSWRMLDMEKEQKMKYKQTFAPLTCHWKMRFQYHDARFQKAAKAYETTVIHLLEADIDDPAYRISDEQRRREWLTRHPMPTGRRQLPYSFCDAFCGAGGATSGALQAGLKPTVAIDFWPIACNSYHRNFPNTMLFQQDVHDFIVRTEFNGLPYIDVLHISPPCQYYSPAKVREGQNDEMNEVALWACGELIEKIRPRIFTMEQTFGLCAERFTLHFNKLIQCFTIHGYSVQWRERVELIQYGLPQNRKRLIIMGAAPGEQLPPWPTPTHGNGGKPWVTEAMAIGRLPRYVTLHDVQNARRVLGAARNPNMPLPRTICCGGPQGMIHYNGQRDYTLRELATLQAFMLNHEFVGSRTDIKKQIGNAFPACVAKVFFESIREFLQRQDRSRMSAAPMLNGPGFPAPGSFSDNRRRTHNYAQAPGYSRLNGDLDEDEALQTAMRESRRKPREVITILDSDDDDDAGDLPGSMDRLSVQPSRPAPPTGESSCQKPMGSWSGLLSTAHQSMFNHRRIPPPLSAASSFTLGNSPSPTPSPRPIPGSSPSGLQSSKRNSSDTLESTQRKRAREVINIDNDEDEEVYYEANIADRTRARAAAREETAYLSPHEDEGQPFTLRRRKWMGKLPVTRDRANDWQF